MTGFMFFLVRYRFGWFKTLSKFQDVSGCHQGIFSPLHLHNDLFQQRVYTYNMHIHLLQVNLFFSSVITIALTRTMNITSIVVFYECTSWYHNIVESTTLHGNDDGLPKQMLFPKFNYRYTYNIHIMWFRSIVRCSMRRQLNATFELNRKWAPTE